MIRGTAAPAEKITLFVGTNQRTTTAGGDGAFRFRFRAPRAPGRYPVAAFPSYISSDVRRTNNRGADVVLVYFHWGTERTFSPDSRQRSLATAAFDAGATIVLGAHPHVLQPIEPRRRRLVAWSLGNFVFGANTPGTESTGILRLRMGQGGLRHYSFRRARIGGVFGIQPILG